ncbi:MarR family winged helix-turn-helix transcriptional regulator [Intrasporangium sp.]|uniref:MarR family winged helix-turn-helix transcriptional regulator n=1 Tax=Intrasporangium sp. TaxID=1925024 RepID=UPI00293B118E|nr:MarR family transcriptional regulator [Intrasporangium sp.]MDV3222604.1 MarR family transcriptional regulator [Intrasporangium sp.]
MSDVVDEIRDGWARVRPDLPTRSVGVITLVWRLSRALHAERAAVLSGLGIDQATLELLANLRRNPGEEPVSPGALATRCGVTPAAISLRMRRAEESGWVTRERATSDARSVRVRLTASGRVAADRFAQLVLEHDDALTAELSDRDLDELERLLRRLGQGVARGRRRSER